MMHLTYLIVLSNNIITNTTISNGLKSILGLTVDDLNFIYIAFSDSNKHYINKVRDIYYTLVDVLIYSTVFVE